MKVGIFVADSNGGYPVPAVKGGAVSTLVEHLVKENNKKNLIEMEIISLHTLEAEIKSKEYENVSFVWVKPPKILMYMDSVAFFLFRTLFRKKKALSFRSIFSLLYFIWYSIRIVNKSDYDKVVLENNIMLSWIIKKSSFKGEFYYHLHNVPRINARCKEAFRAVTSYLCVSEYVAKEIQSDHNPIGPIKKEKTQVLRNCIDTEHFQPIEDEQKLISCRKEYGIEKNEKVIIFVGRLSSEKGADQLLKAVSDIKRNDVKVLIVGGSIDRKDVRDEYQKKLYGMAERLGDQVIFTGYVSQEKLPLLYSMADIAVLPSMWDEPAGLVMIEALGCGLPLITTDSGGIPEYVGKFGTILEGNNVKMGIMNALNDYFTGDVIVADRTSQVNYIKENFSSSDYLQNFINVLCNKG